MMTTESQKTDPTPTLEELAEAAGGKVSRDGKSVVVGYGPIGYLRIKPQSYTLEGKRVPGAEISGRLSRRNGGHQAELRRKLRAAGILAR